MFLITLAPLLLNILKLKWYHLIVIIYITEKKALKLPNTIYD